MVPEKWSAELNLEFSFTPGVIQPAFTPRIFQVVNSEKWVQYLFIWGENRLLYSSSLKKGLSLSFPQNAWFIIYWTWIFLYNTFLGIAKILIFNNMGVSPRLCYFCTDDKQKRSDNAKKIKLPMRKTWKEFSFPAPFIFFFVLLYFHSKNLKVWFQAHWNEQDSFQWPQWGLDQFFYWKVPVVDFDNII